MEVLGIGLTGKSLTDLERKIISDTVPYAIVLFGRNIEGPKQLRELVSEVKLVALRPPVFMIDEEGGRVDRLRHLIPSQLADLVFVASVDFEPHLNYVCRGYLC